MPLASVWSEHLSSPKYLHILLNSLPVYWLAAGVLSSVLALISQNRAARVVALALIFVGTISAWPVYHYGEAAYDRVKAMAGSDGDKWLGEHIRRGEQLIYVFYVAAALSAGAIAAEFRLRHAAVNSGFGKPRRGFLHCIRRRSHSTQRISFRTAATGAEGRTSS